ncbi:hypothetical protein [Nonomuraea sp. NPDC050643]|uniref:hypothetical protein n=1 Tax=Nonomuraea sp. NPDC050643 TaxID=3155660 RepID=UPI0033D162DE
MTALNDLMPPYPRAEQDVTADGLARRLMVEAHADRVRAASYHQVAEPAPAEASAYHYANASATAGYAASLFLTRLAEIAPALADEMARAVWRSWEDAPLTEWTWAALQELGIDPAQVTEAVRAEQSGGTP